MKLTAEDASLRACTKVQLPIKDVPDANNPFTFVTADILTKVALTDERAACHYRRGGQCQLDSREKFCCTNATLQQNPGKHPRMQCTKTCFFYLFFTF